MRINLFFLLGGILGMALVATSFRISTSPVVVPITGARRTTISSIADHRSCDRSSSPPTTTRAMKTAFGVHRSVFPGRAAPRSACSTVRLDMSPSSSSGDIRTSNVGKGKTCVVAGATGYIGKAVVREAVRQGYNTIALVRDSTKISSPEGRSMYGTYFDGASVKQVDVCDPEALTETLAAIKKETGNVDSIVSCLASRSGIKKDAFAIDYQATLNCLESGRDPSVSARHFVLLSAYCVKNPWLQFQKAKLRFEDALTSQSDLTYSIVRPTAFFKSVSGQLEVVQSGAPFVMFGDGEVTRCNPISEADLATYLIDCISDKSRYGRIINLGGPDEPLTMKRQGEMLYKAVGKEPNFFYAPLWLFDTIINSLQWVSDTFGSEKFENAAELGRIGKYYAVEDMLTTDPEEKFGTMTLQEHYNKIAVEGQEYDPYTTMFAKAPGKKQKEVEKEKAMAK